MSEAVTTERLEKGPLGYAASYGRFEARGVLGRGGMGLVLRAHDPKLGRDVALKLLAPERWDAATFGKQRLELEARALAQLSHPNVVTVYEMGMVGEQPFIAMELVDGVTLRSWLASARRGEREIVAMFAACARGLAAAHAAGLVHRDFKPDNVLIGSDGRPRVSDFGLVASEATSVRGVAGTPAYMAPEQWLGAAVDARTDQFALCVALWEALVGARPFGDSTDGHREAVLAGTLRDEPRPRRGLAAIIARGLARDPAERWPSIDDLMGELERAPPRRRRWWIGIGMATAVTAGIVVWLSTRGAEDVCAVRSARIDDDWNAIARMRLTAAFATAHPLTGGYLATYAGDGLDRYATDWATAERAVCAAEPSPINARRAECLEDARVSFARLASVLATANAAVVDGSSAAVDNHLVEIAACEDTVALAAALPPPSEPSVRARFTDILRAIDDAYERALRGEHATALAQTKLVVARARELGHAKLLALALEQQADLEREIGSLAAAEASYRAGADAAADARHDRLAAKMWCQLLFVGAEQGGDLTRIVALEPVADAAVRRAGNPPSLRFNCLMGSGVLAAWRQDLATARTRFAAAAELMKHNPRRRSEALFNLTVATFESEGARAALPRAREAAELTEQANGPNHVATANALNSYAGLALRLGHLDDAERALGRARTIIERRVGRRGTLGAVVLQNLGIAAGYRGDFARARAYFDQAIAIQRDNQATEYDRGLTLAAFSSTLVAAGSAKEALPQFERAVALIDKAAPNSGESHSFAVQYASALAGVGRCSDARPILERADPILSKVPHLHGELLLARGICEAVDDKPRGIATLERALAHCRDHPCELALAVRARWELAKRVTDRARARSLAKEAHQQLVAAGVRTPLVAELATLAR